jgi:cell division protease FtsH
MYRKTRLNFAALGGDGADAAPDDETRGIMETQSERLYNETKAALAQFKGLTEHLTTCLMRAGEMTLHQALDQIRRFESSQTLITDAVEPLPAQDLLPVF